MAAHVGGDNYRCPKCWAVMPSSDFYENHTKANLLSHYCKQCHKEVKSEAEKRARRARGLKKKGRPVHWTRERIIAAIQEWAERFGHPPASGDWRFGVAPYWPATSTVQNRFGSWNAAISAAGFTPLRSGKRRR